MLEVVKMFGIIKVDLKGRKNKNNKKMMKLKIKNKEEWSLLPKNKKIEAVIYYKNGEKEKRKIINENYFLFIFERGARVWGKRFYNWQEGWDFIEATIKTEEDIKGEWRKSLEKALSLLEESGLWADIKENIKNALDIGFEKIREADKVWWELKRKEGESWEEFEKRRWEEIYKIDKRLTGTIIWYLNSPLKIKKMYFGKDKKYLLKEIKEAMKKKVDYSCTAYTSYDVSFDYRAEDHKAWYSEEYKGKGNGHYYLALNWKYAVFWEDD